MILHLRGKLRIGSLPCSVKSVRDYHIASRLNIPN
jgi:hypothetical protein